MVADAVGRLRGRVPTAVAYGMAVPHTMRAALDSLSDAGVERVAVVRLFLSGRSFINQTSYLLGLSPVRPGWFMTPEDVNPASVRPIPHGLSVATHERGLMTSSTAAEIILDRARSASRAPEPESFLLIAHGMGDDVQDEEVLAAMSRIAEGLRADGFERVRTTTLREDWPEQREVAEKALRDFVGEETTAGRRVIVIPFRLSGFGPYASVLEGLQYDTTAGLLPHSAIPDWITEVAGSIACAQGWKTPLTECGPRTEARRWGIAPRR